MNKLNEELFLSIIFVGKWLALGFGALGIVYVAISLAYHKSYLDPRLEKYDMEISDLQEQKYNVESSILTIKSGMELTKESIDKLESIELPTIDREIQSAKDGVDALGLNWWEKIPIPMREKDEFVSNAYQRLEVAEKQREKLVDELASHKTDLNNSDALIAKMTHDIEGYEAEISEKQQEKKETEVDVKGPLFWLGSILGLT